MSDTNVGMGMVPCRKGCRCMDCQLEAKDREIEQKDAEIDALVNLVKGQDAEIERLEDVLLEITLMQPGMGEYNLKATAQAALKDERFAEEMLKGYENERTN